MVTKTSMYLSVEKEKVLALAKTCPEWEKGLKTLFPSAFVPKVQYFRCGTVFRMTNPGLEKRIFTEPPKIVVKRTDCKCKGDVSDPFNQLVMLVHSTTKLKYQLICLGTGYNWYKKDTTYHRGEDGIEIPAEDLQRLEVYSLPTE
jgi:hypothetical protein